MCAHYTVHNHDCCTQYCTEQTW